MTAITLITDFGVQDGHVGAMKGVIHTIAPDAPIVDISHHVPPQDLRHGAFVLLTAYPYWPPDTVHVVVVDPGVGTARRAVAVQTPGGRFVAPDNGVLSYVLTHESPARAVALTNPDYWHHPVSPVFHGRDIFGPAAAHLASGVPLEALGELVEPVGLTTFPVPEPVWQPDGSVVAHVQHVDRFGNCTTDLPGTELTRAPHWCVAVSGHEIDGVRRTFAEVEEGEAVALVDSTGFLAIAVRNGSAARAFHLAVGDPVVLVPTRA